MKRFWSLETWPFKESKEHGACSGVTEAEIVFRHARQSSRMDFIAGWDFALVRKA